MSHLKNNFLDLVSFDVFFVYYKNTLSMKNYLFTYNDRKCKIFFLYCKMYL